MFIEYFLGKFVNRDCQGVHVFSTLSYSLYIVIILCIDKILHFGIHTVYISAKEWYYVRKHRSIYNPEKVSHILVSW